MNYINKQAKAAVLVKPNEPFEVREYNLSKPEKGFALLKLEASGICGTDLHIYRNRLPQNLPLIIGHEFIGIIEDINGESAFKKSDKVIFNMAVPCGKCKLCQEGDSANCVAFSVAYNNNPDNYPHFFGGYAEYTYANLNNLIKVPDKVTALSASMFPCAGPTIIHSLKLGKVFNDIKKITTAVVQGLGPLGLFSVLWLVKNNVKNIIVPVKSEGLRKEIAKNLSTVNGKEKVIFCSFDELSKTVYNYSNNLGADLVIECSGNPEAFNVGCNILRNRGLYLVPGQYSNSGFIKFEPQLITFKALQIIGSSQYDSLDVKDYMEFLENNRDILPYIESTIKTYKIKDVNEAIITAEKHLYGKVVFVSE
jgi:threonine dehydrogenase-like Zn-dependent dehydrogenase